MAYGLRPMLYARWPLAYGLAYGLWLVLYGIWPMAYGLCPMDFGL